MNHTWRKYIRLFLSIPGGTKEKTAAAVDVAVAGERAVRSRRPRRRHPAGRSCAHRAQPAAQSAGTLRCEDNLIFLPF